MPRVIAITSGKGGVGKSNFVLNVGICLAMMEHSVQILDADLGLANLDVLMGSGRSEPLRTWFSTM
jgi:flagellar biosynthesis protein FlhG